MAKPLFGVAALALFLCPTAVVAACHIVPSPRTALAVDGFYTDRDGTVIDQSRREKRDSAVAVYEKVVRSVQAGADAYMKRADRPAADCAVQQLSTWAAKRPLTGELDSKQAEYERNWYLAGFALAYLKLKPIASERQRTEIEDWLRRMSDGARASLERGKIPGNNLTYWAGFAIAAAGLATGSEALLDRAHLVLIEALGNVSRHGTLSQELSRGSRALSYHAFAAGPLVLLAYIAETRGKGFDKATLARLCEAILSGMKNPAAFAVAAKADQEKPADWNLAWLPAYNRIMPTNESPSTSHSSHFLGGDVRMTIQAIRLASIP